jgi:hypothetical protein
MKIRTENGITVITADEGKVLRRICDGFIFGKEIWLGKAFILGSEKLATPVDEQPEHFEDIPMPEEYINIE